jgi:hypothetical protein
MKQDRTVADREAEVLLGTRLAAERLPWDEDAVRAFQRRRLMEAERRRQAKLPVTERTMVSEMSYA